MELNILSDFCSKIKLSNEDPKWIELFKSQDVLMQNLNNEGHFLSNMKNLIKNNNYTNNLNTLIGITVSRLRQIRSSLNKSVQHSVSHVQLMTLSVYLLTQVFHFYACNLSITETKVQLGLNDMWPDIITTEQDKLVASLIEEILLSIVYYKNL